jgi:hypothetical protein
VSFAALTLYVAFQQVSIVYFAMDSVRKLLDTPSYMERVQMVRHDVGESLYEF